MMAKRISMFIKHSEGLHHLNLFFLLLLFLFAPVSSYDRQVTIGVYVNNIDAGLVQFGQQRPDSIVPVPFPNAKVLLQKLNPNTGLFENRDSAVTNDSGYAVLHGTLTGVNEGPSLGKYLISIEGANLRIANTGNRDYSIEVWDNIGRRVLKDIVNAGSNTLVRIPKDGIYFLKIGRETIKIDKIGKHVLIDYKRKKVDKNRARIYSMTGSNIPDTTVRIFVYYRDSVSGYGVLCYPFDPGMIHDTSVVVGLINNRQPINNYRDTVEVDENAFRDLIYGGDMAWLRVLPPILLPRDSIRSAYPLTLWVQYGSEQDARIHWPGDSVSVYRVYKPFIVGSTPTTLDDTTNVNYETGINLFGAVKDTWGITSFSQVPYGVVVLREGDGNFTTLYPYMEYYSSQEPWAKTALMIVTVIDPWLLAQEFKALGQTETGYESIYDNFDPAQWFTDQDRAGIRLIYIVSYAYVLGLMGNVTPYEVILGPAQTDSIIAGYEGLGLFRP